MDSTFTCIRCFGLEENSPAERGCHVPSSEHIMSFTVPRGPKKGLYGVFRNPNNIDLELRLDDPVMAGIPSLYVMCSKCRESGLIGFVGRSLHAFSPLRPVFVSEMCRFVRFTDDYVLHAATGECLPDVIVCNTIGCGRTIAERKAFPYQGF